MMDTHFYAGILDFEGLPQLSEERLAAALLVHQSMRASLEALRRVPFSYTEPVVEPTAATAWINAGGLPAVGAS